MTQYILLMSAERAMRWKRKHINEGGMDNWSNKKGVVERYTRGGLGGCIKHRSDLSGGTMFLAHHAHREVEDLVCGLL